MILKFLSLVISKIKKENFILDKKISFSYLFVFMTSKFFAYMRFIIKFKTFQLGFIGKNSSVFSSYQIKFKKNLSIGNDCVINALSKNGIVCGNNVSVQKRTIIECTGSIERLGKGLVIGNNVGIGSNSFLGCAGGIEIGDDTIIGNYVSFHAENHNYSDPNIPIRLQGVNHQGIKVGKNCWIGAKATILDGAVIGNGCIIAAGAVVNQGFYEDNCIYGGVPAKLIKKRFQI